MPPGSLLHRVLEIAEEQHELAVLPKQVLRDPDAAEVWTPKWNQRLYELALDAAEVHERARDQEGPERRRRAAAFALNVGLFLRLRDAALKAGVQQQLGG